MILKEEIEGRHIELTNARVQLIQIDFRLSLLISDGADEAWARIETAGTLKTGVIEVPFLPDNTQSLAPILELFNIGVRRIRITKAGRLSIELSDERLLEVCADDAYEAWQVECKSEKAGFMLVCAPGGEVNLFSESHVSRSKTVSNLN